MNEEEIAALKALADRIEKAEKTAADLKASFEKSPTTDKATLDRLDAVDKLIAELKTNTDELVKGVDTLTKAQEILAAEQAKAGKGAEVKNFATIDEALMHAMIENKDAIDAIVKNGGKQTESLQIAFKVITMGEGNTIGDGDTQVLMTQNTGTISTIRRRELRYQAAVSVGTISNARALWVEELDESGTPVFIAEAGGKTQLSVRYEEKTASVKKIAVYGKITTELMADLPQFVSYIKNNLMKRLDIKIEDKLISATGAGQDPYGAESFATAFAAGDLASMIEDANEFDVLEAIALQCEVAYGIPNNVFIHPSTWAKMRLLKDDNGRPLWKDYVTIDGKLEVSGMRIIKTTAITAGNFLGGDTSVIQLLYREQGTIQVGLDGNDFTNNLKTILVEKRMVQFVSANDTAVLIKGDFTTAKAALQVGP